MNEKEKENRKDFIYDLWIMATTPAHVYFAHENKMP